jgi:hypothetical protein
MSEVGAVVADAMDAMPLRATQKTRRTMFMACLPSDRHSKNSEETTDPAACAATHYPEKKRDLARVPGPMGKKNLNDYLM